MLRGPKAGIGFYATHLGRKVMTMMLKLSFFNASSNFDVLNVSSCHLTLLQPTRQQIGWNNFFYFHSVQNSLFYPIRLEKHHRIDNFLRHIIFWIKVYPCYADFWLPEKILKSKLVGLIEEFISVKLTMWCCSCRYINYGSLAIVIGHEITHGFDSTGSYN